jgi:hypothetical protein
MRAGPWRFLLYLLLPQPAKMAFLPAELGGQLDRINLAANVAMYSGSDASGYDAAHCYDAVEPVPDMQRLLREGCDPASPI